MKSAPSGDCSAVVGAAGWKAEGLTRVRTSARTSASLSCVRLAAHSSSSSQESGSPGRVVCSLVVSCRGPKPGSSTRESHDLGHVLCPDCTVVSSVKQADDVVSSRKGRCEEA